MIANYPPHLPTGSLIDGHRMGPEDTRRRFPTESGVPKFSEGLAADIWLYEMVVLLEMTQIDVQWLFWRNDLSRGTRQFYYPDPRKLYMADPPLIRVVFDAPPVYTPTSAVQTEGHSYFKSSYALRSMP